MIRRERFETQVRQIGSRPSGKRPQAAALAWIGPPPSRPLDPVLRHRAGPRSRRCRARSRRDDLRGDERRLQCDLNGDVRRRPGPDTRPGTRTRPGPAPPAPPAPAATATNAVANTATNAVAQVQTQATAPSAPASAPATPAAPAASKPAPVEQVSTAAARTLETAGSALPSDTGSGPTKALPETLPTQSHSTPKDPVQGALDAASGIVSTLGHDLTTPGPNGPASSTLGGLAQGLPALPADLGSLTQTGVVNDALDVVGGLAPALGGLTGTPPTALLPNSLANLLPPVIGSLPTVPEPARSAPKLAAHASRDRQAPAAARSRHEPPPRAPDAAPRAPAPTAPGSGPGDNPAGPVSPGGSPAPPAPPSDPFGPGSPVSWPGSPATESGHPVSAGAGSFLGTPPSALASTGTTFVSASDVPPAEPGNGPQHSPSIPLPSAPGPAFSPGAAGGWFFIPLAALMALVGLSAPAIMRRLREAAAFPAPTPFVCALERPG